MKLLLPFLIALVLVPACALGPTRVPEESPPLADMEAPVELAAEPQDEAARAALPAGAFSGIELVEVRATLEDMLSTIPGVEVARVVENSPADHAGVVPGDVIVSARIGAEERSLAWPSDWRAVELAAGSGTRATLVLERASALSSVELVFAARTRPGPRVPVERWQEGKRVGVVLRTATEVEARAAGLAPGAGAVVVGLARGSPWRGAGVVLGDLVTAVDGAVVAHPEVLVLALRTERDSVALEVARAGKRVSLEAPLSSRARELTEFSIPFIYSYESDRGSSTTSAVFGLYKFERTPVAWRLRLLWFIVLSGGEADRLEELDA